MSAKKNGMIRLLQDLIAIPSVNPTGDPGTDQVGEQKLAEFLAQYLVRLGADVQMIPVKAGRPNVVARFRARHKARAHLCFAPHTDTVSVAGMTIRPFDPVIKQGKVWGRGASDTKGPMATMLWALQEWAKSPARARSDIDWTFVGLMGEEAGNEGAIALAESGFKADLVIVGEPTSNRIVYAHKGALWLTVRTRGVSCHASTPERGNNAIYEMAKIIRHLETKVVPALKKKKDSKLGPVSLSVGTIAGGSKVNIVPDTCQIECDIRTIPGFDNEDARDYVSREIRKICSTAVILSNRNPPPLATDPQLAWVKQLRRHASGYDVAPWFSDAAVFGQAGSPSVALGPGSIAQAHTRDEFIKIADLEKGYRVFRNFLMSF